MDLKMNMADNPLDDVIGTLNSLADPNLFLG